MAPMTNLFGITDYVAAAGPTAIGGRCACHRFATGPRQTGGGCYWCYHSPSEHARGVGACENQPPLAASAAIPELARDQPQIVLPRTTGSLDDVLLGIGGGAPSRDRNGVQGGLRDP